MRGEDSGGRGTDKSGEEQLEDHEAEEAAAEAERELREDEERQREREYQKMAADLRWEVLEYIDAHPDKSAVEVARFFGLREGTIRAWKAHRTMGTYQAPGGGGGPQEEGERRGRQRKLFREGEKKSVAGAASFVERKRYSNFIHFFDKTPAGIVCPHFYILAHANGCPFGCAYCYLRLTLRHYPEPTVFSNTARMFQEVREWLLSEEEPAVLNAGELSDALAWDRETELTCNLIPLFASQGRHKLLLVTKSTVIDHLLKMEPSRQVIVSFSVNAVPVAERYEPAAPSPLARLEAARQLQQAGWEMRFRLDPLLPLEGWQEAYADIIARINELAPTVITLGSLRFFKNLLHHAPAGSDVFSYGFDHNDPDGRFRLPPAQREEMYRFCLERLKCLRIGLCKETDDMHRRLGLPGLNQSCNCTPG